MSEAFNPYQEWLGLTPTANPPDHFALLGLEKSVTDPAVVRRAADQRKSQVRSCRPGPHAAAWGKLLDEIESARHCLTDPQLRAAYEADLTRAAVALPVETPAAVPRLPAEISPPAEPPPLVSQAAPPEEAPVQWEYDGTFVVPTVTPVGPAAQLLPPTVALVAPAAPPFEMPPQAPLAPPVSFAPTAEPVPSVKTRTAEPDRAAPRTTVLTPGIILTLSAITVAIAGLAVAIVMLSKKKPTDPLGTDNNSVLVSATTKETAVPPLQPTAEEEPTPAPQPPPDPMPPTPPVPSPPVTPPPVTPPHVTPPPVTPPMPVPNPAPQPVPPTAEQTQRVKAALSRARQLLAERDPKAASAAVKEAEQLASDSVLAGTIAPTATLVHYGNEFWSAVRSAIPKLAGGELAIGDTKVFVIEGGEERILIRMAGQNREFTLKTMPSGLARTIAEGWLVKSPTSKMIVGAFLAVDPTMVSNSGREKARKLWKEAAAGGADAKDLLRWLDEPR